MGAPASYLVQDDAAPTGRRGDESGRRPSQRRLVPTIGAAVNAWREGGEEGAGEVARRLFQHRFDEEHGVLGCGAPCRDPSRQREARETLAWLVEIAGQRGGVAPVKLQRGGAGFGAVGAEEA